MDTGQAMRRREESGSRCRSHGPDAGLVARHKHQPMFGKAFAEVVAIGAAGPCQAHRGPNLGKVDAMPLRRLMLGRRVGGGGPLALSQTAREPVGDVGLPFSPESGEHGDIVSAGHDGMAEQHFKKSRHLLMPGVIESRRENAPGCSVRLSDDEVPVTVGHARHCAGLPVFHNHGKGRVEIELIAKCLRRLIELLTGHRNFRRDHEMPERVNPVEPPGVIDSIVQVGDGATDKYYFLVVVAASQVPGQCASTRRGPDSGGLDEHGPPTVRAEPGRQGELSPSPPSRRHNHRPGRSAPRPH